MPIDPSAYNAFDAKAATPDTSVPEGAVFFGADSQSAGSMSVWERETVATALAAGVNAANGIATVPAPSGDAATDTAAIQAALDAIPDGGGMVRIHRPGTYLLKAAKANPYYAGHQCCLEITKGNTHLWIGPGVTLKLDDGEQTDAGGPVDIIVWSALDGVTINGGGTIDGNATGQSGWTGGYAQVTNGCIIYDCTPAAAESSRIKIEDLTLHNHFSNPVNLTRGGSTKRVRLHSLTAYDCGEGLQVIKGTHVEILNCDVSDPSDVSVGDGIELSVCTHFRIDGCRVEENGVGAAFDLWGSKHGVLSNFQISNWGGGGAISAGTAGGGITVDDVVVSDGVIRGCTGPGILEIAAGRLVYRNIDVVNCTGTLFQMSDDAAEGVPPVELYNVLGVGCNFALITGSRRVIWDGGGNRGCSATFGLQATQNSSGETRDLHLRNLDFTDNASRILFNAAGLGPQYMTGYMENISLDGGINATNDDDFTGMVVRNVGPDAVDSNFGTVYDIAGRTVLRRSSGALLTLKNQSKGQQITIEATGSTTITDQSQTSGVDIFLAGSANFAMAAGDRLGLQWNGTGWYEMYRTVA